MKVRGLYLVLFFSIILSMTSYASTYKYKEFNPQGIENSIDFMQEYGVGGKPIVYNWVKNFKLVDEVDFYKYVREGNSIAKVTVDEKNTRTFYITMENGGKYKIYDPTDNFLAYLQISGIETTLVTVSEAYMANASNASTITSTTTSTEETENLGVVNMFIQSILIAFTVFVVYAVYSKAMISHHNNMPPSLITTSGGTSERTETKSSSNATGVKLDDVEGVEGLKEDVMGLVDCLKHPKKYTDMGARIPNGVILYGPPGTGKTLLAKAIAGEAGVPFYSAVGSDFVEKYVGVGASRVRSLYEKAKRNAPCIVFIDEVDAVAGSRGYDSNSERDQTINALLSELDGFQKKDTPVITICATNRLDMLDDAFMREGRFDLKLAVGLPDKKARLNILKIHGKNKKFAPEVSLEEIATKTQRFSGAALEALLNESALRAVRKKRNCITRADIDEAYFKILMKGNKKKRESLTDEAKVTNEVIAWHEAGHAIVTKLLAHEEVTSVTIVGSTSGAGGVTFTEEKEDSPLKSKKALETRVMVLYAGRAAEQIYFGSADEITTGASNDIQQATNILKQYLTTFGMGNIGLLDLSQFTRDSNAVLEEASEISKRLYENTLTFLTENVDILRTLSNELLDKETLNAADINTILQRTAINV